MTENARGCCQKQGPLVSTRASSTNVSKPENQKTKNTKNNKSNKKEKTFENYVGYYHILVLRNFVFFSVCVCFFFGGCVCVFFWCFSFLVFLEQHLAAKRWEGRWGTGGWGYQIYIYIYRERGVGSPSVCLFCLACGGL